MKEIRAAEAAGKKLYVQVDLKVQIEDTSFGSKTFSATAPESPLDMEVRAVEVDPNPNGIRLIDSPAKASQPNSSALNHAAFWIRARLHHWAAIRGGNGRLRSHLRRLHQQRC
jgi:hypothetical protein